MESLPNPTFTVAELKLIHAAIYAGIIRNCDIQDGAFQQVGNDLMKAAGSTLITSKIQKEFKVCGLDLALPGFTAKGERI